MQLPSWETGTSPSPASIKPMCPSFRLTQVWAPPPSTASPITHFRTHTGCPFLADILTVSYATPLGTWHQPQTRPQPFYGRTWPTGSGKPGEMDSQMGEMDSQTRPPTTSFCSLVSCGQSPSPAGGQVLRTRMSTLPRLEYPLLLPPHDPQGLEAGRTPDGPRQL